MALDPHSAAERHFSYLAGTLSTAYYIRSLPCICSLSPCYHAAITCSRPSIAMTTQVLMFSQPRTACHVLERMLSGQSDTAYFGHAFGESVPIGVEWEARKSGPAAMPEVEKANFEAAIGRECNRWRQEMTTAVERVRIPHQSTHMFKC